MDKGAKQETDYALSFIRFLSVGDSLLETTQVHYVRSTARTTSHSEHTEYGIILSSSTLMHHPPSLLRSACTEHTCKTSIIFFLLLLLQTSWGLTPKLARILDQSSTSFFFLGGEGPRYLVLARFD